MRAIEIFRKMVVHGLGDFYENLSEYCYGSIVDLDLFFCFTLKDLFFNWQWLLDDHFSLHYVCRSQQRVSGPSSWQQKILQRPQLGVQQRIEAQPRENTGTDRGLRNL